MFDFDHVGLTTTEPQPDENWIEQSRCWVTNPRNHPEHIEFLRYAPGTTVRATIRMSPTGSRPWSRTSKGRKSSFRRSSSPTSCESCSFASTEWCSNTCSI
jgi:hypothetical protein